MTIVTFNGKYLV